MGNICTCYFNLVPKGIYQVWRWAPQSLKHRVKEVFVEKKKDGYIVKVKDRLENKPELKPKSVWYKPKYTAALGTNKFTAIIGESDKFSYPKSVSTVEDSVKIGANKNSIILDYFAGSGTTGHAVINLNREDGGHRQYILVEMGDYFDTVLRPRMAKVVYAENWKNGKPMDRHTGISHCFKYIRLESYEDTLNNLRFDDNPVRHKALNAKAALKQDYMLRYMLDVETRGSQSLLNIDAFVDPAAYTLEVKKPGTDAYETCRVDLMETFNFLIGLRVIHMAASQTFTAKFKRIKDPEVSQDQKTKLVLDGKMEQMNPQMTQMGADSEATDNNLRESTKSADKIWWFRKIEGRVPRDPANPDNGQMENVLIVWRKLTGDLEKDNLMLDEWFDKNRISPRDFEFDTIYVNGSNNLPNLRRENENWKVCLIEETFFKRMWHVEGM